MTETWGNALIVKEINTNLVRRALQDFRSATKQELASATGLSLMTVSAVLRELEGAGEALQGELVPSSGGRPSRKYRYNPDCARVLVIFTSVRDDRDVIHLRVADAFNDIVWSEESEASDIGLSAFVPLIDSALARFHGIRALGFGLPGIIHRGTVSVCDFAALVGTDFAGYFGKKYGLPLIIDNDVNCAAFGSSKAMEDKTEGVLVCLYFPGKYAFGSGITIDGKIHRGHSNYAGETADLPLGIDWCDAPLYDDEKRFSNAVARVLASFCCVLDPEKFVLYGSFLTGRHIDKIRAELTGMTRVPLLPEITLSNDFVGDYQKGLIFLTRELLKPSLELKRKK